MKVRQILIKVLSQESRAILSFNQNFDCLLQASHVAIHSIHLILAHFAAVPTPVGVSVDVT